MSINRNQCFPNVKKCLFFQDGTSGTQDSLFGSKIKEEPVDYDDEDSDEFGDAYGYGDPYDEDESFMPSKLNSEFGRSGIRTQLRLYLQFLLLQVISKEVKTISMVMINTTMIHRIQSSTGADIGNVLRNQSQSSRRKR